MMAIQIYITPDDPFLSPKNCVAEIFSKTLLFSEIITQLEQKTAISIFV